MGTEHTSEQERGKILGVVSGNMLPDPNNSFLAGIWTAKLRPNFIAIVTTKCKLSGNI